MVENNTLLELDYSCNSKAKRTWLGLLVKLLSLVVIIVLTSYQSPKTNEEYLGITYSSTDLEYEIFSAVYALEIEQNQNLLEKLNGLVQTFYLRNDFRPVWTSSLELNHHLISLTNLLDSAKYYGFPADYFGGNSIKEFRVEFNETRSLESRVNLELASTFAALKFMLFMNRGIVGEEQYVNQHDYIESLPELLASSIGNNSLRSDILALQPDFAKFQRILNSLPHFIDFHSSIKYTTPKFIDDNHLAKALFYAGVAQSAEIDTNDNNTKAIAKLQMQFNLPVSATLNRQTHEALVSLLQYRYYQACLNLHRLRALQNKEENFLFVNIPEFKLHVVEEKRELETFNVIVGKTQTPTPVFSSRIDRVITNPHWTVPKSITSDMLPKIRKDSTYLQKNGFYVINGREQEVDMAEIDWNSPDPLGNNLWLRQRSSQSNALGLVKFMFPNDYSVYIHDTPSRNLFNQQTRTFSYGCIRLENPDRLAQYLAERFYSDNSLNVKQLISSQVSKEINLVQQVAIHIQYITCSGKDDTDMEFYGDIYNLDRMEMATVFQGQLEI